MKSKTTLIDSFRAVADHYEAVICGSMRLRSFRTLSNILITTKKLKILLHWTISG